MPRARRRSFTKADKRRILQAADRCTLPGEIGALMRREGIDMWIVITREYNDDPVFRSMSPLTTYASRRRTMRLASSMAMTCAERGPSSMSDSSPKYCPGPRTPRMTSRPSSPTRTTFTRP